MLHETNQWVAPQWPPRPTSHMWGGRAFGERFTFASNYQTTAAAAAVRGQSWLYPELSYRGICVALERAGEGRGILLVAHQWQTPELNSYRGC